MRAISFFKKKEINVRRVARRDYYGQKTGPKTRFIFFILLFLVLFLSSVYLFIYSPHCKVNKIEISIDDYEILRYAKPEIEDYVKSLAAKKYLFFIPANSLVLFPVKQVKARLAEDQRIENFSVEKIVPDILKINLKIFEPKVALLDSSEQLYLLNEAGQQLQAIKENIGILPMIEDKIGDDQEFNKIIKFILDFNRNFEYKVDRVEIYRDQGVIVNRATTSEKWQIYFDSRGNLEQQTSSLFLLLREKIKDRSDLSYIELRFGDKIFYK